jgi:hypothetical protein
MSSLVSLCTNRVSGLFDPNSKCLTRQLVDVGEGAGQSPGSQRAHHVVVSASVEGFTQLAATSLRKPVAGLGIRRIPSVDCSRSIVCKHAPHSQ